MTLPPERLVDKGQRYEIHCVGYPEAGDCIIGWSDDKWKAADIGYSMLKAPSAISAYIRDRQKDEIIEVEP